MCTKLHEPFLKGPDPDKGKLFISPHSKVN